VRSIRYAVAYLGVVEVSRIFLTEVIRQEFSGAPATQAHGIWRHSYLVAVGARRLHQRFARSGDSRTLYAAALLHDLGKLVYLRFFPEHFGALDAYGAEHGVRFADAEEHLGLPPHRAFGALLCDHFRLPSDLKAACLNHDVEALERLVDVSQSSSEVWIALADALWWLSEPEIQYALATRLAHQVRRILCLDEPAFDRLLASWKVERQLLEPAAQAAFG
jgi:HD-like signal output (HDOD) protein